MADTSTRVRVDAVKELQMADDKRDDDKPAAGEQQSDATTQANKPDNARAKDDPKAGNILAGVQPKS